VACFSLSYLNFHSSAISALSHPPSEHTVSLPMHIYICTDLYNIRYSPVPGDSYISYRHLPSSPIRLPEVSDSLLFTVMLTLK
jgi:hypothetical protein